MNKRFVYSVIFVLSLTTSLWSIGHLSFVAKKSTNPIARDYPAPISTDAWDYATIAKNIVTNGHFSISTVAPYEPDTFRTPGYVYFLVFFYKIFGNFYPVLFAQALISFLTCVLLFKIGEKLVNWKWSLAVVILYIIDPNTMFGVSYLFSETLFMFAFVAFIYTFFFAYFKNAYLKWGFSGLLIGLAALIKPVVIFLAAIIIVYHILFFWKKSEIPLRTYAAYLGIFLIVFITVLSPWYVRNKKVSGVWGFSSVGTYGLFREILPRFLSTLNPGKPNPEIKNELAARAGLPQGPVTRELKYSSAMQKVFFEVVMEHPVKYAIYHLGSLPSFFLNSGVHHYMKVSRDMVDSSPLAPEPGFAQALVTKSWSTFVIVLKNHGYELIENSLWAIIEILFLIGLWHSKNKKIVRMFAVIILYFAILTGPISHARYRIPATPMLLLGAVCTVSYFWDKKKIT